MRRLSLMLLAVALGGAVLALLDAPAARAGRCGDQHLPRCGLDSQTEPPTMPGGSRGCTEASRATLPLFEGTGQCAPGETMVIYDVAQPFPDNGLAADQPVVGSTSFITMRAGLESACAHMIDDVDPKPCPDPQLCPDAMAPQPEGARKVALSGYLVGCWSRPDRDDCRDLRVYSGGSVCLHAQHELLGAGCTMEGSVDCAKVSTEHIAFDLPGGANRRLCPPIAPATSCRGTRANGKPGLRFRIGGFCSTNNCANAGTAPSMDAGTCDVAWGATNLGYDRPSGKGINAPGWYDWKTGAFRVDLSSPKPTCGALGVCLGERTNQFWDLRVVAVPRPGEAVPCVSNTACDAGSCLP